MSCRIIRAPAAHSHTELFHGGEPRAFYIDMHSSSVLPAALGGGLPYVDAYSHAWSLGATADVNRVRKTLTTLLALRRPEGSANRALHASRNDGTVERLKTQAPAMNWHLRYRGSAPREPKWPDGEFRVTTYVDDALPLLEGTSFRGSEAEAVKIGLSELQNKKHTWIFKHKLKKMLVWGNYKE